MMPNRDVPNVDREVRTGSVAGSDLPDKRIPRKDDTGWLNVKKVRMKPGCEMLLQFVFRTWQGAVQPVFKKTVEPLYFRVYAFVGRCHRQSVHSRFLIEGRPAIYDFFIIVNRDVAKLQEDKLALFGPEEDVIVRLKIDAL